jgi:hypothetical protein
LTSAGPSYKKKQAGGNPALIAAASKAADALGSIVGTAGDLAGQVASQVQHRRDVSGFYDREGAAQANKKYNELVWRRNHGIARWRTNPKWSDANLRKISGLDKYL